jgi:hypothetical protein
VRNAIERSHTVWEGLSPSTVKDFWNCAKILLMVLAAGHLDEVVEGLKAILLDMSNSGEVEPEHLASNAVERWTAAALSPLWSIGPSECWLDQPRFGLDSISPEIGYLKYYRVLNIINLKLYNF